MRSALVALAAAMIATPLAAQTSSPVVEKAPEKMVCKKFEKTGSRLGTKRICATEREWAQRAAEDQKTLRNIQDTSRLGTTQ